jgi:hypothetical protein
MNESEEMGLSRLFRRTNQFPERIFHIIFILNFYFIFFFYLYILIKILKF